MATSQPLSNATLGRVWRGLERGESLRAMANGRAPVGLLDLQLWAWRARGAPLD